MLRVSLISLLVIASFTACSQSSSSKNVRKQFKQLDWITGQWNRTNVRAGQTATETWKKESKTLYTGMGVSMKGNDTTFVEKLRIEIKDDKLYYVADVRENAAPTYFEITEITEKGFVSRNPDHDFPKMISYDLKDNVLTAVISDGAEKKIGFFFEKLK